MRQQIGRLNALSQLNRWNGLRAQEVARVGQRGGTAASLGKLMASHIARQWRETATTIVGGDGMLAGVDGPLSGDVAQQALFAPAPSIYGGCDQVHCNIIGERVLGLPKDPDFSRHAPFRDLKAGTQPKPNS